MGNVMRSLGAALVCAAVGAPACSSPPKGALVLSISTDMRTPKDLDILSIFVTTASVAKFDYLGRVQPDGTVKLPSTLAIVEPDDPSAQVRIRIIGFQGQKARVLRDVLTTVPHQRSALLRVPLNFIDDGSAIGMLPADKVPPVTKAKGRGLDVLDGPTDFDPDTIGSKCPFDQGQTMVNGACTDDGLDSSGLPDYADDEVFGDGGTSSNEDCFDVTSCFAAAAPVANFDTKTCTFPLPTGVDGASVNVAIVTADGTGDCVAAGCIVPLEVDSGEGFSIRGGVVTVVEPVCSRVKGGESLVLDTTGVCPQKTESDPVCEPTTDTGDGGVGPSPDASAPNDAAPVDDGTAGDGAPSD